MSDELEDQLKREYEICKQRGHQSDGVVYASSPPKQRCKWCHVFYWTETTTREGAAP